MQPLINPYNKELVNPNMLEIFLPREIIRQEVSGDRFMQIPEEVRDVYHLCWPMSSFKSTRLEGRLKAKARTNYNYGGIGPPLARKNDAFEEVIG